MSANARLALFCLIGLLLVILGFLVAFAVLIRRRPPGVHVVRPVAPTLRPPRRPSPPESSSSGGGVAFTVRSGGDVGLVAAGAGHVACPTCRREYEPALLFCPHDARRLVPSTEMSERARAGGSICPRCRRGFDPGIRFCPHDATELVPASLLEARRAKRHASHTGIIAKICPQCRRRYDLAATFCGKDGAQLRTLN